MKTLLILLLGIAVNSNAQSFSSYVWEQKDKAKADSIAAKKKPIIIQTQTVKRDTIPSKKR